jgi:hypothetical protein
MAWKLESNMSNSPVPVRVDTSALGSPDESQPLVEFRFTNTEGATEVWLLRRETLDFEGLGSAERVRMAYLDNGVDSRIARQRESIERLLRHVDAHHSDLASDCTWKDPDA